MQYFNEFESYSNENNTNIQCEKRYKLELLMARLFKFILKKNIFKMFISIQLFITYSILALYPTAKSPLEYIE